MATFHDSALGSASASSVGPLATADALAVTAGDLVVASAKWETGTTTVSFDSGASTPLFTVANAVRQEASGLSICGAVYFWIATATGTINPRFTLGVARDFREIRAISITPAAGKTFVLGNVNAADGPNLATAISAGTAAAAGSGVGITAIALNGSRTITPGSGWTEPAELNTSISAHAEYQLISGAGTITGDCTLSSAVEWVDQLALFMEVSTGGAQPPLPTITLNPGGVPMGFSGGSMGKSPGYGAVRWQEWEKYPWGPPGAPVTIALTGTSITFSTGLLAPSTDVPLTGVAETYSAGTLTPSNAVALLGVLESFAAGTLGVALDVRLSGTDVLFNTGTLTPSGDVTVALTGTAITFSTGALGVSVSVPLVGATETYSAGALVPASIVPLSGVAGTYSVGTLAPLTAVPIAGTSVLFNTGTMTATAGGDVTVALTGIDVIFQSGTLTPSGGDSGAGSGGDWLIRMRRRGVR